MSDINPEIEQFIRDAFEENYELLRLENGRGLTPDGRDDAFRHVLLYWYKLRDIAESVTDTEVKLTLPGCISPGGREFAIEGVVDIVRERDRTTMYDIKTHDPKYVRQNCHLYQAQLNVYAYIWQHLRGQPLDETAVIATVFPDSLAQALESGDKRRLERELRDWEPLVVLPFDAGNVDHTIQEFGAVVDKIEEGDFAPRTVADLDHREGRQRFATAVCRNCDARFSCESYRAWALRGSANLEDFRRYFSDLADRDIETFRTSTIDSEPDYAEIDQDLE